MTYFGVAFAALTLRHWGVASSTVCKALQSSGYVCDPMTPNHCLPLDALLFFRSRMSRVLLHRNLPYMVPVFERGFFEPFANISAWRESGSLASLHQSTTHLTLALALICQGLIEAEERMLHPSGTSPEPSVLELAAAQLLPAILAGSWLRVTSSGWPVFALLRRLARLGMRRPGNCQGTGPTGSTGWWEILRLGNATGVVLPSSNLSIQQLADFRSLDERFRGYPESSCLWQAADELGIPAGPVCVMLPPVGVQRPYLVARDCNDYWPRCEAWHERTKERSSAAPDAPTLPLRYWMHLPGHRDLTADHIREEQRPFCTHNKGPQLLAAEVKEILAKLAAEHEAGLPKRPLKLVEVGGWMLRLNRATASIVVRELALSDGRQRHLRWQVPSFSGAHASAAHGVQAEMVKREGTEWRMRQVAATSLDSEFGGSLVDLLLVSVAGEEMETLMGAEQMLHEKQENQEKVCLEVAEQQLTVYGMPQRNVTGLSEQTSKNGHGCA
eukprot:s3361_g7.t1